MSDKSVAVSEDQRVRQRRLQDELAILEAKRTALDHEIEAVKAKLRSVKREGTFR